MGVDVPSNVVNIVCKSGEFIIGHTFNGQMKAIERRMNISRTLLKEMPESSYDPNVVSPEELENIKKEFRNLETLYQSLVRLRTKWSTSHFSVMAISQAHKTAAGAKSLKFGLREVSERAANHESLREFEAQIEKATLKVKVSDARALPSAGSEGGPTNGASTSTIIMATERESQSQVPLRVDISQTARTDSAEGGPRECAVLDSPTSEPTDPEYMKARHEFLDKAADVLIRTVALGYPTLHVDADTLKAAVHAVVLDR
ncbi:hypothetical protein CONPUDRAFT_152484 [Coniophora puteana RWD-64-598 SS2]|uniref:Uncharacterized protein n=1 Tax=Coniophora puteana (strain RWD-64-598) TaxID=741705 RepID=A0A5M3MWD1_CONPW|nr:uncharacterized protein CONPUDRAFT_152484 [Coniophora puteana RWD-64-598 SS2]EIW83458.1 hypothetical protein CONPUDRAFT_152484 [Coniophora puteana RWD-64-598 SS2]